MLDTLAEWVNLIIDFFYRLLLSIFDYLKDFFWWMLDMLFGVAISILESIDFGAQALNPVNYIDAIPAETKYYMGLCGFNECISIIVIALGIRFVIQLIPFVRWGS